MRDGLLPLLALVGDEWQDPTWFLPTDSHGILPTDPFAAGAIVTGVLSLWFLTRGRKRKPRHGHPAFGMLGSRMLGLIFACACVLSTARALNNGLGEGLPPGGTRADSIDVP